MKVNSSRVDSIGTIISPNLIEDEYLVPFDVPIRHHRRASLGPVQEKSKIRKAELRKLKDKYSVLDNIRMTVPSLDDRILSPRSRCIAFYEDGFDAGVRFLLHPFIKNVLDFYKVTPIQFSPNDFRVIISFIFI